MTSEHPILILSLLLASLAGIHTAHAQERYIYWIGAINAEETRGNTIFRYSQDSGVVDTLIQAMELERDPGLSRYFYSVTVDTLSRRIYWTDSGGTNPDGSVDIGAIMRASLEGDSVEVYLGGIVCSVGAPRDIEVDIASETLYWSTNTDCPYSALHRARLENASPGEWYAIPTRGDYQVSAIEFDLRNQVLYWTNNDFAQIEPLGVYRAPIHDTLADEYIIPGSVCDIAIAHMLQKIYWVPCGGAKIRRANLDGTDAEDIIVSEGEVGKLAIDQRGGEIYWTDSRDGKIRRANLDGTEVEDLLTGLVVPTSIALNFGGRVHVGVDQETALPGRVELQGVYPNPVAANATIAFALSEPSDVTLEIYDQLGRQVEVVASGMYPPGTFRVQWNPVSLANGVYFCRMASKNRSKVIPLVLHRK